MPPADRAEGSDAILARMLDLFPKFSDLSLGRMERILADLGHPERSLPAVVHVAGTNGKGSTVAMLRAGIEGAGLSAHVYISPHLARFHERIRLSGRLIDEGALSDLLEEVYRINAGREVTFFEITTAAAMLAFAREPADYLLLETGLGGRLDATNVVAQPRLTVITPVDLDHQQYLGETLAEIAGEKAGILKRGVPLVLAPQHDEALAVIEARAERLGCPVLAHGQHWHVWEERGRLVYQDESGLLDLPMPALLGPHQVVNAGTTIAALRHLGLGETACEAAVTQVEWPARMQRLREGPLVAAAATAELWLDGGHNPAAGAALAETLATLPPRPLTLVTGMLSTKDVRGYFAPLAGLTEKVIAVAIPGESASLSAAEVADAARQAGHAAETADTVSEAVERAARAHPAGRILISGSLYLAGAVLRENG